MVKTNKYEEVINYQYIYKLLMKHFSMLKIANISMLVGC
jgi:hypothetical protein